VVLPIDEEVIEWRMTGPHALPTSAGVSRVALDRSIPA